MYQLNQNQIVDYEKAESSWKGLYRLGGIAILAAVMGTMLDIIVSSLPGWGASTVPETAIERFAQFQGNWLLGLYNLDILNNIISIIMIPTFCALYAAHKRVQKGSGLLALIIFIIGTSIFVANNVALPMLDLSIKYSAAATETQRTLLAAAGEALIARGGHGSAGAFMGFILSTIASLIMSYTMLKGKIFSRATAYVGFLGFTLLLIYMVFITFISKSNNIILILAMPGGILAIAWNVMVAKKLLHLGSKDNL